MCNIIFIVGNSRSGTTMLGRILGNNEKVFTFHELHFFEQIISSQSLQHCKSRQDAIELLSKLMSIQREGYLKKLDNKKYQHEANALFVNSNIENISHINYIDIYNIFLRYETKINQKLIPCEQTPRNLFYLDEILNYFPNSRIINIIRDPRSVLLSQKNKWKRRYLGANNIPLNEAFRSWVNYHPILTSKLWNSSISKIDKYMNNASIHNIYFEDLILNPEETVKTLCNFVQIDYHVEMLKIPHVGSSTGIDAPETIGIKKDRSYTWKDGGLSNEEVYLCQSINKNYLLIHGYNSYHKNIRYINLYLQYIILPIKLFFVFILNIKRHKNIYSSFKRRLN